MNQSSILFTVCLVLGCSRPTLPLGADADLHQPSKPATRPTTCAANIPGVGNFAQVSEVLFRGEQPTAEGFAELKKRRVKTIVNLRSFHDDDALLQGTGLRYVHIRAKAWHPEDEDVVAFLKVVENPENQAVFVHCQQGSDRTGYMVAAYRIVEQGWTADDAIAEMQGFAFHPVWIDIPTYLKNLQVAAIRASMASAKSPNVRIVE